MAATAPAAATSAAKPLIAPGAAPAPRPQTGKASPLARKLAAQQGTDLDRISGSGPGGVVTAADIQRAPAPFEVAVPGNGRPMKSMEKAIARAMAHEPAVVMADEPTASLDPINAEKIMRLFSSLAEEHQVTLIVATHEWDRTAT